MTSKIKVLKEDIYEDMKHNFSKYDHLYKQNNKDDRLEFFEENSIDIGLDFDMPELVMDNENPDADIINAERIYKSLSFLTHAQSSDMRIWTYLCGTAFYEYICNYLGQENVESGKYNKNKIPDDEVSANTANTAFLTSTKHNVYRSLATNFVARLWWAANMCKNGNDFSLLKVINPLPGKMVLTRKFFSNDKVAKATLKALYKFYSVDNNNDFSSRPIYNIALKEANIISSSQALDVIPEDLLENEIYTRMKEQIV
ncbi:hypothetical protein AKUH4B410M_01220 [Apilactobacillus kunkeei]|nr:hypothetical protein AKUH4B102A_01230 [Apilactobacillus kunkeei]CAI2555052.1 hypothetical protein AKUH4B405J_01220 [Apilactobacillus kunkeei]CAI2555734.1 hypothetical protein AKUH4B410M_01220 [Apilactobacillus kunkeei]CAI2615614.1 hypothetical protein AKUH3B102X_01220 [Apilactobacillus kunkeei]